MPEDGRSQPAGPHPHRHTRKHPHPPPREHNADDLQIGRDLVAALGLEPLPLEGGLFRRTYTGAEATAIHFALIDDDFSAMHRLTSDEVYFHHAGAPLRILLIDPDGAAHEILLGSDVNTGQRPQCVVPSNWWQGSSADGAWCLVSTVVTPGFDWSRFELGDREALQRMCPGASARITALTREDPQQRPGECAEEPGRS